MDISKESIEKLAAPFFKKDMHHYIIGFDAGGFTKAICEWYRPIVLEEAANLCDTAAEGLYRDGIAFTVATDIAQAIRNM